MHCRQAIQRSLAALVFLLSATMIEGWFGLGKSDGETSSGRDHEGGVAMVDCLPANRAKTLGVNGNVMEYRIAMPYDLHAAEKGKKFAVASISQDEDDGGGNRAVELVYAETRRHPTLGIVGVHTKKLYHIGRRLPLWVSALLPGLSFDVEEEAWTLGPHGEITLVDLSLPMLAKFRIHMRTVNLLGPPVDDAHRSTNVRFTSLSTHPACVLSLDEQGAFLSLVSWKAVPLLSVYFPLSPLHVALSLPICMPPRAWVL